MSKQTMGEFLATLRKANGYTQQEVAEKLNISNRTLSSWETDRTTPDVLLLPAVADLYGVTVDELLRCERSTDVNENKQISEKALRAKRKHSFGKYSAKYVLLSCLGCFGAVLFALAFVFELYTSCPLWLFILLIVLAVGDMVACGAVHFYNLYNAKLSEGLVLNEDYSDDNKAYAMALKNKASKFLLFCALPLITFAVIMLIVFLAVNPENYKVLGVAIDIRKSYYITIGVTGGLGVALLAAYLVYANANFKSLANEIQAANHSYNAKLATKTVGFGAIPVAIFMLLAIVFNFIFPTGYAVIVSADTPEDYKRQMQTITITESESEKFNKPAGDYYLDFPEAPTPRIVYDLGNGFCGVYGANGDPYYKSLWQIYVLKTDELPVANEYGYIDGDDLIYGSSYFEGKYVYSDFGTKCVVTFYFESEHYKVDYGFGIELFGDLKATMHNGKYIYAFEETLYLDSFFLYLFIIVTGITVVTGGIIYCLKRKKQSYEF